MIKKKSVALYILLLLLTYCTNHSEITQNEVRVRLPQDPENLNPISYTNIHGLQIVNLLFQTLLSTTGIEAELKPLLAQSLPVIQTTDTSTLVTYQLQPEATWDNGSPIRAADVIFSMKVIKSPLLNNEKLRMRYESVQDVRVQASDSLKVTFVCDKQATSLERLTGALFILPRHLFDPERILDKYTVAYLSARHDSVSNNADIKKYAEWFNSQSFTRDKQLLNGSGAYVLEDWKTGQEVSLQRKTSWWVDKLPSKPEHITANPARISFQIIPDNTTALLALKDASVDVYSNIPSQDFIQLKQDPVSSKNYNFLTPETYDFTYIGINSRSVKFSDRLTRQAIRHLIDVPNMIAATQKGFAVPTSGPFKPNDPFYNTRIQLADFNIQKAAQLLQQAGWQKEKELWVKVINEDKIPLTITLLYRAGNTEYESIALILKDAASRINIPVDIQAVEGNTLTDQLRSHNFDMFIRGISGSPGEYDFSSILHTESAAVDGNNYTGFGTAESDALIDAINHAANAKVKAGYLKRFQEILYEEATIIFLYTLTNRIAINKRLSNVKLLASKYGYDVSALTFSSP